MAGGLDLMPPVLEKSESFLQLVAGQAVRDPEWEGFASGRLCCCHGGPHGGSWSGWGTASRTGASALQPRELNSACEEA